ncbi:MAG: N-acetyltransferase, partial [Prochlorococcus sp.]
MLAFRQQHGPPQLPSGFMLESQQTPNPADLNKLLSRCREATHTPKQWVLAFERSVWHLSIFEQATGNLAGFVRATSDHGLNANLWDLVAQPGELQEHLLAVLVDQAIDTLCRTLPGCSISVLAPAITLKTLKAQGFIIDPDGIRAMTYRL